MKLKKKRYDKNKKIRIYYSDEFSENLIKYVVNLFLKRDSGKNLILIRARKGREVYKLELDKQVYYLKKFEYRNAKKIFKNLFRPEEAVRSLKKLYKLLEANIPVVKPVAAITWEKGPFINDSVLITKECKSITVKECIINGVNEQSQREKIIKDMAKLWAGLFNNHFIHKDYNLTNFMINLKNYNLVLADIDNIYFYPILLKRMIIRNMAKFNARLLFDIVENNLPLLSVENKLLFYREFEKNFKRAINLKKFIIEVYKATIKRLIEKNKADLIRKDDWLANYIIERYKNNL